MTTPDPVPDADRRRARERLLADRATAAQRRRGRRVGLRLPSAFPAGPEAQR